MLAEDDLWKQFCRSDKPKPKKSYYQSNQNNIQDYFAKEIKQISSKKVNNSKVDKNVHMTNSTKPNRQNLFSSQNKSANQVNLFMG